MKTSALKTQDVNWPQEEPQIPREPQIEFVRNLLSSFNHDYCPPLIDASIHVLKEPPVQTAFEEWLMEMITPALFQESGELPALHKKIFLASLNAVEIFVRHFNIAIKEYATSYKDLDPLYADSEMLEKKIVLHMNELCLKEKLHPIVPADFNDGILQQNMKEKITALLRECFPKVNRAKQEFLLRILSSLLQKFTNRLFSSEILLVLLDKLLNDKFLLTAPQSPSPLQEIAYPMDETFNKELEHLFSKLAKQAIVIGSDGEIFIIKWIHRLLIDVLMHSYKEWLGHAMQRILNRAYNSNAVLDPIIFIAELLYTMYSEKIIPTMDIFLKKEDKKMYEIKKRVEETFKNILFRKINHKIKSVEENGHPNIWTRLTKDSIQIKKLCNNLENAAILFLQRPLLLKTLLGYLLENVKIALKSSNEEVLC